MKVTGQKINKNIIKRSRANKFLYYVLINDIITNNLLKKHRYLSVVRHAHSFSFEINFLFTNLWVPGIYIYPYIYDSFKYL